MSIKAEKILAREKFLEEYEEAKNQIFGLLKSFLRDFRHPHFQVVDLELIERQPRLLVLARDAVKKDINEKADAFAHASPKNPRGYQALFKRFVDREKLQPCIHTVRNNQFSLLTNDDTEHAIRAVRWRDVSEERQDKMPYTETRDDKVYYLYRAVLSTFVLAAAESLCDDPWERKDAKVLRDVYAKSIKRFEELTARFNMRFTLERR